MEHLIVLLVLRKPHRESWTRAEVDAELDDIAQSEISEALVELEAEGVVLIEDGLISASRCTRRIDDLHMICV
jgi:hypothetical protein